MVERIKNGDCDEIELLELVTDNEIEVAIAVAESNFATAPIIDIAAHDRDRRVRWAAVNNPNIGKETLKILSRDNERDIAELAQERLKG